MLRSVDAKIPPFIEALDYLPPLPVMLAAEQGRTRRGSGYEVEPDA